MQQRRLPSLMERIPGDFIFLNVMLEILGGPTKISRIGFSRHLETVAVEWSLLVSKHTCTTALSSTTNGKLCVCVSAHARCLVLLL